MHEAAAPAGCSGLTQDAARERLQRDGPNELRVTQGGSLVHALAALLREPLFVLLFVAAAMYLWLGDRTEALALVASAAVAAAITVYQKYRTERVLIALRDLSSPRAMVVRDGVARRVASREVVCGDCIVLREGDRVPADAELVSSHNLLLDESILTGEAVAVHKFAAGDGQPVPVESRQLYANTLVVAGHGLACVTATGPRSRFGEIGQSLGQLQDATTPLQRDTAQLARWFGLAGGLVCVLLVLGYGLLHGAWTEAVLRGLTLAMAILPEEFPLVITVFMALGAWRLARHKVLTRRAGAIEALGAATLLCVDKTGTLTQNRMRIARAVAPGVPVCAIEHGSPPQPALQALAREAALASEPQPFDPMEQACHTWANEQRANTPPDWQLLQRYPLQAHRLVVGHAWRRADGHWHLAVKGAPEHVLPLCSLSTHDQAQWLDTVRQLADDGMRVLAVAAADLQGAAPQDLAPGSLGFAGLLGFHDPLRETVPQAVADCHRAGLRILMITGDFPQTAAAIAREAGLAHDPVVLACSEIDAWDDATLVERLRGTDVVARATPLAKLRLVQVLQAAGEVVAMTGDGVNDAPALRAAHIGVAMGQRGCDVAREAAGIVLLEDDFGSLVTAVRQGRRIFANLRQALLYVLAVHLPLIGISLLPVLVGGPPLLLPLHVMFMEFVIDPACSLAFEAEREEAGLMSRPPRRRDEHVLDPRHIVAAVMQGLIALGAAVSGYALAAAGGSSDNEARTVVFMVIVLCNVVLILHDRRADGGLLARLRSPNPALWAIVAATLLALAGVLGLEWLRQVFRLALPDTQALVWVAACVLGAALALEAFGWLRRRRPARMRPA